MSIIIVQNQSANAQPGAQSVNAQPDTLPHGPPAFPREGSNGTGAEPANPASPRTGPTTWPHGWTYSGSVTAHKLDMAKWPRDEGYADLLCALTRCTLTHLGGARASGASLFHADAYTNICGNITIGVAVKPSKADAFRELGARVWIRGIGDKQRERPCVGKWLRELADVLGRKR